MREERKVGRKRKGKHATKGTLSRTGARAELNELRRTSADDRQPAERLGFLPEALVPELPLELPLADSSERAMHPMLLLYHIYTYVGTYAQHI